MANSRFTKADKEVVWDGLVLLILVVGGIVAVAGLLCFFNDVEAWWIVILTGVGIGIAAVAAASIGGTFRRLDGDSKKVQPAINRRVFTPGILEKHGCPIAALLWLAVLPLCFLATSWLPGYHARQSLDDCVHVLNTSHDRAVRHSRLVPRLREEKRRMKLVSAFLDAHFDRPQLPGEHTKPVSFLSSVMGYLLFPFVMVLIWRLDNPRKGTIVAGERMDANDDDGVYVMHTSTAAGTAATLKRQGSIAVLPLAFSRDSGDSHTKLQILAEIADERAVGSLGEALIHGSSDEAGVALNGLLRCGRAAPLFLVRTLLTWPESEVARRRAADALQKIGYYPKTQAGKELTESAKRSPLTAEHEDKIRNQLRTFWG